MTRTVRSAAIAALTALAAVAAIIAVNLTAPISAQSGDTTGRIVARLLDDGRIEFGWQPSGGERVLPRSRYFPANARVDRWLRSSPVEVKGAEIGRINVRLHGNGRIEFAFTPTNGERIQPSARYFPANAQVGRWLSSTEITIGAPEDEAPAASAGLSLSAGVWHTCGLRETGAVECWGDNAWGQADAPAGQFSAVSAGWFHSCGLRETGAIECWGSNYDGQADAPAGQFSAVSAGWFHSCGLRETGAIECWGWNDDGQADAPAGRFSAVSAGYSHTCGLRETGAVECWGANWDGQTDAPAGRFSAVSAGDFHTCGLRKTGAVECWGNNGNGQANAPAGQFSAVSAGGYHTCGLRETGAVECWGYNGSGQADKPAGRFSAVSGGSAHTCGLRETGAVECWGLSSITDAPSGRFRVAGVAAARCPEPPLIPLLRDVHRSGRLEHGDCLSMQDEQWADVYRLSVTGRILVNVQAVSDQAISPKTYLSKVNPIAQTKERVRVGWLSRDAKTSHFEQWLDPGLYELEVTKVVDRAAAYDLDISPVMAPLHNEDFVHQIASLYAPTLHFSQGEKYFPTSVETMLARSDLKRASDDAILARREMLSPDGLTRWNGQSTYLDLDDTDRQREARGPKVVYTIVADIDDGTVTGAVVQYWFFYLYNETLPDGVTSSGRFSAGAHEGDWEGIQLFFENRRAVDLLFADAAEAPAPDAVGFASHNAGFVGFRIDQTAEDTGACGALDVYVARNRHASYPQAGTGKMSSEGEVALDAPRGSRTDLFSALGVANGGGDSDNPLGGDVYRGDGTSWHHVYVPGKERYELRVIPVHATSWVWWDGKWGEDGGPRGPAFKLHFRNSPVLNFLDGQWWRARFSCEGGWTTHPSTG